METLTLCDFHEGHVDRAARLLSDRYRVLCAAEPHLPSALADPYAARGLVAADRDRGAVGFAAVDDRTLAGFLLLEPKSGRVGLGQYAAAQDDARRIYRHLYATLAQRLVNDGVLVHAIAVPVADVDALQTWFELGFGVDQVKGTRTLEPLRTAPTKVHVRRGTAADGDDLAALSVELSLYHKLAPMLKPATGPFADLQTARRAIADELADARASFWIAVTDTGPVGFMQIGLDGTARESALIGMACTTSSMRHAGVGTAILARALRWAAEEGYKRCRVGWSSANLISDRFWRSRGFRPVYYTLSRTVGKPAHE